MDHYRYYTMEGGGKSIEIRYYFEKYRAACYIRGLVVLSGVIWSKLNVKLKHIKAIGFGKHMIKLLFVGMFVGNAFMHSAR